jgi:hypothetical protein
MTEKKTTTTTDYSYLEGRVGRVEGAIESLTHEVQETNRNVRDIINGFGRFKEDVLSHIGQATAPKWPLITSFIMVCLTIIGLGGTIISQGFSGQTQSINRLDDMITEFRLWKFKHIEEDYTFHGKISGEAEKLKAILSKMEDYVCRIETRQFEIAKDVSQLDYLRPGKRIDTLLPDTKSSKKDLTTE